MRLFKIFSVEDPKRQRNLDRVLVLALGALMFLPGLGNHDLWNPDEPRYAEVAREMRVRGDYFLPHVNGEVYTHKPPLMFWSMAAAATLTGELNDGTGSLPFPCRTCERVVRRLRDQNRQ